MLICAARHHRNIILIRAGVVVRLELAKKSWDQTSGHGDQDVDKLNKALWLVRDVGSICVVRYEHSKVS